MPPAPDHCSLLRTCDHYYFWEQILPYLCHLGGPWGDPAAPGALGSTRKDTLGYTLVFFEFGMDFVIQAILVAGMPCAAYALTSQQDCLHFTQDESVRLRAQHIEFLREWAAYQP